MAALAAVILGFVSHTIVLITVNKLPSLGLLWHQFSPLALSVLTTYGPLTEVFLTTFPPLTG